MNDDPKHWNVRRSQYVFDEPPWLTIREDHVVLPNGAEIERYWVAEFPPWVNVVAVTPGDEVVLIRQYRHGLGSVHYELPAGCVESDSPLECAQRELLEETGYGGGEWSEFMTLSANPGLQSNLAHTFLATNVTKISEPSTEPTEDLVTHLVPLSRIAQLVESGEIVQAMHAAPLLKYVLSRQPPSAR